MMGKFAWWLCGYREPLFRLGLTVMYTGRYRDFRLSHDMRGVEVQAHLGQRHWKLTTWFGPEAALIPADCNDVKAERQWRSRGGGGSNPTADPEIMRRMMGA